MPGKFSFVHVPGAELLWFLEVLCRKTTLADNRYMLPRLSSAEEDHHGHVPSDLQIQATRKHCLEGENVYGLQFMVLKSFRITAPKRPSFETVQQEKARKKQQDSRDAARSPHWMPYLMRQRTRYGGDLHYDTLDMSRDGPHTGMIKVGLGRVLSL